jgi:formylglycine-generating enzyme required for sulfatase activity
VAAGDNLRVVVAPLLDNGDWSETRIAQVNSDLRHAGEQQIAAAMRTEWFESLSDTVRRRLKEQQALSDAPLTPDKNSLAALAVTLGIDVRSPDAALPSVPAAGKSPPGEAAAVAASAHPSAAGSTPALASSAAAQTPSASAPVKPVQVASSAGPDNAAPQGAGARVPHDGAPHVPQAASAAAPTAPIAANASSTSPSSPAASQGAPATPAKVGSSPACRAELARARVPYCQDTFGFGGLAPRLAVVPAGSFQMGNAEAASERPVLQVSIARPFAISVQEVSQEEFRLYCQKSGKPCAEQPWSGDDYPVVRVSWRDAREYTQWLSQATGERYRLATEAEWEYAARAGQTGLFPSGDSLSPTDAYFSTGARLAAPARRNQVFNANAWRLLHMVGNVREWVEDTWSPTLSDTPTDGSAKSGGDPDQRVVRGGSYADGRATLRLTTREHLGAGTRDELTGIRIVREIH